ncbi:uncharacterized protein LOC107041708 isoform X2 [Diachasma alloeum]|nr:uncharacterized protein LOC107041708 isoform X2 [Diachasma alloeum]
MKKTGQPCESPVPDSLNILNDDCLAMIFQHLPIRDKLIINTVCKRWKEVSPLAWQNVKTVDFEQYADEPSTFDELPDEYRTIQWLGVIIKRSGTYLKHLKLSYSANCKLLPLVGHYCENLTTIDISYDFQGWDWAAFFPKMQKFRLAYKEEEGESLPEKILPTLSPESLTEIRLSIFYPNDVSRQPIPGFFSPIAAKAFQRFTKLEVICLSTFNISSEMMDALNQMHHVKSLFLPYCNLNQRLPSMSLLANLEHLNFSSVKEINDSFLIVLSDIGQNLKSLALTQCNVTDEGIGHLRKLRQLEELDIGDNWKITGALLGTLKGLRKLNCQSSSVFDEGLIELIKNAPNLENLELMFTNITELLLMEANEITKRRTNKLPLKMEVDVHVTDDWNECNDSPLLFVDGVTTIRLG